MKTNARAWYMAAATVAFAGCSGDPVGESIANQVQALDAGEFVLLNEIELNPPGADTPWQYIELEGTPGASLAGFQVAVLEGAGAASAQMVVDLGTACGGPCVIGSSGLLVIKAADVDGGAQGHVPPAGATVVKDAQLNTGALTTGNTAVLLVQGSVAIVEGGAIARGDGGAAILPAGDTLVDGVGWGGAGALVGVAVAQAAGTPDAATRFRNRRDVSAGAWYAGNLAGPASTVAYTAVAAQRSANFPAGGVLTPGAVNLPLEDDAGSDAAAESATPDGGTVESGTSDAVAEAATTDVANETSVPVEAAVDSAVRDASPDAVADVATDRVVIVPIDGAPPVGDAAQDGLVSGDTGPTDDGAVADAIADATGAGGAGGSAGAAGTGGGGTGGGGAAGARLDGGGAAGTGGGAGPDGSDVPAAGDSGGCGCRVPGRSPVGHHGMLALFGLAAWAGARRRRNRRA